MKTVAIIQARMGSTRLPGKVLKGIAGRPMIDHVVGRARRISGVDEVVVATSTLEKEQPLVRHLKEQDVPIFQGAEEDVLGRYLEAAASYNADVVVRITADCPLLSPDVSGRVIRAFQKGSNAVDYASNSLQRTYPRGLDTEVFSFEALEQTHREAIEPSDREHVTRFMWQRPGRFRHASVVGEEDNSHLRWTVDEQDDLRLVRCIYSRLDKSKGAFFEYTDILQLLEREPELQRINEHVEQKSY